MSERRFADIAIDQRFRTIVGRVCQVVSDREPWSAVFVDEEWNVVQDNWVLPDARLLYYLPAPPPPPSLPLAEYDLDMLRMPGVAYRCVYANQATHYVVYQKHA